MRLTPHAIEQIRQSARDGFYLRCTYGPETCTLMAYKHGHKPHVIVRDRRLFHFEKMRASALAIYNAEWERLHQETAEERIPCL